MRPGLGRGLLFGLPVALLLWAAILIPVVWGLNGLFIDSIAGNLLLAGREFWIALRPPPEKPDYFEIQELERVLGMGGADLDRRMIAGQVTYHGHVGPCTSACPHP